MPKNTEANCALRGCVVYSPFFQSGSFLIESMIRRRVIQLRLAISVGVAAIGAAASMKPGYFCAQIQVSIPPIELPITRRACLTPRCSVTRRCCASTMSS